MPASKSSPHGLPHIKDLCTTLRDICFYFSVVNLISELLVICSIDRPLLFHHTNQSLSGHSLLDTIYFLGSQLVQLGFQNLPGILWIHVIHSLYAGLYQYSLQAFWFTWFCLSLSVFISRPDSPDLLHIKPILPVFTQISEFTCFSNCTPQPLDPPYSSVITSFFPFCSIVR